MLTGINHLTLAVGDLGRSVDFYVDLLGCVPRARWARGAYLSAGDLWLCLAVGPVRPAGDYTHVAFSVAEGTFDVCVARLMQAGVRIWQSDSSEGDSLYFLDPDGHRLELHDGSLASRLAAVDAAPYEGWTRAFDGRMAVRLRAAERSDVPAIECCARAAYAPYVERIGREPAPMVADFAAAVDAGEVRVAVVDTAANRPTEGLAERTVTATVAGYVVTRVQEDALLLENVAVAPGFEGRGVGGRLIRSAEEEARRAGLGKVTLYTNVLMHENLALYPQLGYTRTGERRENGFDRVYFEKTVTRDRESE